MIMMRRIIHFFLLTVLSFHISWAHATNSLKRHFIIAVDVAYANSYPKDFIKAPSTRDQIFELLKVNNFNENDYLTFVSYALNLSNPNFETFVSVATDQSHKPIFWRQYEDANVAKNDLSSNWSDITIEHHQQYISNATIGSMQSLAKEYVLKAASPQRFYFTCDETILLMITDDKVNAVDNNYVNEYYNVSTLDGIPYSQFESLKGSVFDYAEKCNNNYRIQKISLQGINGLFFNNKDKYFTFDSYNSYLKDKLKIVPYRVLPTTLPSIQTITDIPSTIPFKTVKGGYTLKLDVKMLDERFGFSTLNLVLPKSCHTIYNNKELFISRDQLTDGDSISLELEVLYKDGIYNGITMSPKNPTYKNGMTLKTKFSLQENTKIMGLIPLHDSFWWFYPNNVEKAVLTWDLIIILIFIMIICYIGFGIFRHITRFTPKNSEISLKKN